MKLPNSPIFSPQRLWQDITEWARKVSLSHNSVEYTLEDIYNGTDIIVCIDTTDDIIIDTNSKGLVLVSPDGHYWRVKITNNGAINTVDTGTTKP